MEYFQHLAEGMYMEVDLPNEVPAELLLTIGDLCLRSQKSHWYRSLYFALDQLQRLLIYTQFETITIKAAD